MMESAGKIFHSNENYTVTVNDDCTGYLVTNDQSGVIEFACDSLPEAIFAAENMNVVLTQRTYEWVGKHAKERSAERNFPGLTKLDS